MLELPFGSWRRLFAFKYFRRWHAMSPQVKWVLPALVLMIVFMVLLLSSSDFARPFGPMGVLPSAAPLSPANSSGFLVQTPGCRIPYMDAFDPGIRKYLKDVKDIECSGPEPLILSNQTSIWVNQRAIIDINVTEDDLNCCHQPFWRSILKERAKVHADSAIAGTVECTHFKGSAEIYDEFVKVTCFLNGTQIYRDYHAFIKPRLNVNHTQQTSFTRRPSVLVIGIDAVSRLNFYRQMPQTLHFLHSREAIELMGYNKVDDNTFPNLVPVLAGKSVDEIRQSCWKNDHDFFDDCQFIWKDFHNHGYQTGFGEDACWMGIFQYLKSGFFQQPVDNYLHTMMTLAEDDIGHAKNMNAKLCVGSRLAGQVLFEYAEKFAINLTNSDKPFFGFFWGTSLTHDYLNVLPKTDVIYHTLLQNLERENVMENTVVVVMSDHGIRWGPIRETYQGRIEERLPLVFFMLPSWIKEEYPSAVTYLLRNRRMLTSPFDLHETLKDLLDISSISGRSLAERSRVLQPSRGISLFMPVPVGRTCEDAGIPENWCTCHQSQNISIDDPIVTRAAAVVVDFINHKLFQYMQCAQLTLFEVKTAQLEAPRKKVKSSSTKSIQDVTVVLVTSPGLGEFEATVRHHLAGNSMEVLGYVSRINTYGSQSKCVDNFHMRLYCYCS